MVGARSGSRWSAPGAAICWQPVSLAAMPAAQRATIGYSWSPTITTPGTWIWASLEYAGGSGRIVAEPEEGLSCPADLGLRGLVGTGSCPGPQAQVRQPIPAPTRVGLVKLPER